MDVARGKALVLAEQHHSDGVSVGAGFLFGKVGPAVIVYSGFHVNATGLQSGSGFFGVLAMRVYGAGVAQVARLCA